MSIFASIPVLWQAWKRASNDSRYSFFLALLRRWFSRRRDALTTVLLLPILVVDEDVKEAGEGATELEFSVMIMKKQLLLGNYDRAASVMGGYVRFVLYALISDVTPLSKPPPTGEKAEGSVLHTRLVVSVPTVANRKPQTVPAAGPCNPGNS